MFILRGDNNDDNEQKFGLEDMRINDGYEDNIIRNLHNNPCTVIDNVTAVSVKDMIYLDTNSRGSLLLKRHKKEPLLIESENKNPKERLKLCQKRLKDEAKMTRLRRSKHITQIEEEIKKSKQGNDNIEIKSNFPIYSKLKPLYKGKLILQKNKELEGFDIEMLRVNKFYDANISMNANERVELIDKEIIDKTIQKLSASGNYYVEHNKAENFFIVGCNKKQATNTSDYLVIQFVSQEATR